MSLGACVQKTNHTGNYEHLPAATCQVYIKYVKDEMQVSQPKLYVGLFCMTEKN